MAYFMNLTALNKKESKSSFGLYPHGIVWLQRLFTISISIGLFGLLFFFCFWFSYRFLFRFFFLPYVRKIYLAIKHGSALEHIPGAKTRLNFAGFRVGSETPNNFNSLDHKNRTNSKSNSIKTSFNANIQIRSTNLPTMAAARAATKSSNFSKISTLNWM